MTFEEACVLQASIVTSENLRTLGVEAVMAENRARLAEHDWTPQALCEEAARRMRSRIRQLTGRRLVTDKEKNELRQAIREGVREGLEPLALVAQNAMLREALGMMRRELMEWERGHRNTVNTAVHDAARAALAMKP